MVERQLREILSLFWTRYGIHVVVVLEGLRPQCLAEQEDHETRVLKMSHEVWSTVQASKEGGRSEAETQKAVFKSILQVYGSRFYMQEVINATKSVQGCSFFVAPYTTTAQLAQFYADELI